MKEKGTDSEVPARPVAAGARTKDLIARRRAFAIISHPDAGKTTLTEKFLLYGGAVQLAGSVTARRREQSTSSDWMEIERKRGISVSSTVLQFGYSGYYINLLDTPGHRDFSEDTYRVLMAVDSVIMLLDAAKGIEAQTFKLFEICRLRNIPIFTFINKLDRPSREPLELLDEIEQSLGLRTWPANWPLGSGREFKGVLDRRGDRLHFFDRIPKGAHMAPETVTDRSDAELAARLDSHTYGRVAEELAVLDGAGEPLDLAAVREGRLTPVFFGSAMNNFGVRLLLDGFLEFSLPPRPQLSSAGPVAPDDPRFSGFVFKIQSNMDPRHRDQIAFVRVCSGRFERDMKIIHTRTGAELRLSSTHKLFGRERETVDEAFAGDIIGVVGHPEFRIGDTLSSDPSIVYPPIPRFAPEHFAFVRCADTAAQKKFRIGLAHLLQEGVVQSFDLEGEPLRFSLLGAVGPLQFEVLRHRLQSEYGAAASLEEARWTIIRWAAGGPDSITESMLPSGCRLARDRDGNTVALFAREWDLRYFGERHPSVELLKLPPASAPAEGE
ncbi:MAG: peptide chain release factor 3 [Elusimicrobiales bacterium]|nr:peptide chain release factor 3 [Elusimicrobiales bacterium]